MRTMTVSLLVLSLTGMVATTQEVGAQGGTAPQSQSMGESRSGSAIDSKTGPPATKDQFDEGYTGQEPGITEKGSGQGRSTMERTAGKQSSREKGAHSSQPPQKKNAQNNQR